MFKKKDFGISVNLIKSFSDAREASEFCRRYKHPRHNEQKPF
jgi:hypothetical protein